MLGAIYNDEGEKEIAIKEYEKAIAIDTNNAEIFFNLGCDKQQSGDIKGACEDLLKQKVWKISFPTSCLGVYVLL